MGSISLREHIRWLPDEASEPTSTVVVTSPQRRYVDLRIFRPEGDQKAWSGQEGKHSAAQVNLRPVAHKTRGASRGPTRMGHCGDLVVVDAR